jgi:N-hydroxyarylamine O-acetyltransferase
LAAAIKSPYLNVTSTIDAAEPMAAWGDWVMAEEFDLGAYLRRIAYDGPRGPSFAVLGALVSAHAAAIPYENIDVLLKRGIRLDLDAV